MALTILAYMAIIGFLGWSAWRSGQTEKVMFLVNIILLWLSAVWMFGYPALIIPAVIAAVSYLALLVLMMSSDLWGSVAHRQQQTAISYHGKN